MIRNVGMEGGSTTRALFHLRPQTDFTDTSKHELVIPFAKDPHVHWQHILVKIRLPFEQQNLDRSIMNGKTRQTRHIP